MKNKIVTVFGGTGFVGKHVVRALVESGYLVRVVSRNPDLGMDVKLSGSVGQVAMMRGNIRYKESVEECVRGSYAVVNLVGVLYEKGRQSFSAVHAQGAERLAKAAKFAGAERFIHVSALGVDRALKSRYARTKITGEKAVINAFPDATILRPGVIFGAEDNFLNQLAKMAKYMPFVPVFGGGRTKFQPVYVGDVAKSVAECINNSSSRSKVYEIAGPDVFTFRELVEYVMQETGHIKPIINVPFGVAALMGRFMQIAPKPLLTSDQITLLHYDNVTTANNLGLHNLGIQPLKLQDIAHRYLNGYQNAFNTNNANTTSESV